MKEKLSIIILFLSTSFFIFGSTPSSLYIISPNEIIDAAIEKGNDDKITVFINCFPEQAHIYKRINSNFYELNLDDIIGETKNTISPEMFFYFYNLAHQFISERENQYNYQ